MAESEYDFKPFVGSDEAEQVSDIELVTRAIDSYTSAKSAQEGVSPPYTPSGGWSNVIGEISKMDFFEMGTSDALVVEYLKNFFRNDSVSGLWDSGHTPFVPFSNMDVLDIALKNKIMNSH